VADLRLLPAMAGMMLLLGCATPAPRSARVLDPYREGAWAGNGISYGPYRDGQRPGGPSPTRDQMREDLALLRGSWSLLRVYAADGVAADLLALIREERLPFRVLLGAWIAPGEPDANRRQVETAVRLAEAYPDEVLAICVGNETQVSWSGHRVPEGELVGWIREARRGTRLPVATADDFGYWLEPRSDAVAAEVDFLVVHVYAMWNGKTLDEALDFTRGRYAAVAARHPGKALFLGEAGWATRRHVEGEQARLIRGEASEEAQRVFLEQFSAWVSRERIPSTWFEAFDENWKGGPHPDEVEKHWGLYRSDRTPKKAVRGASGP
jgi:exo-beta-1,3-glucanase (GH17 family)